MITRPATPQDAPALARLHAASFDAPWSAEDIAVLLGGPGGFGLVAGDARAFLLGRVVADEAEILTVAVDPPHRGGAIGSALVEAAARFAASIGASRLFLEVAVDNVAALALYHRCGFEPAGRRTGYYRRPEGAIDALVLRRDLTA